MEILFLRKNKIEIMTNKEKATTWPLQRDEELH